MKIAYISHHGRPCYEYEWFNKIDFETIKFLDTDFSAYPDSHAKNIEYCKVEFKENKFVNKFLHSTASIVHYFNFEKYLHDVDVVIVLEVFSSLSKQFTKYCKKNNKKIVTLVYELIPNHPIYYLPTHYFNRIYNSKNSDLFICVSNLAKDHLIALNVPQQKIEVVYPGINIDLFKPAYTQRDETGIIFVGGLNIHKGINQVITIYQELLSNYPNQKLHIAGSGPYADYIYAFCQAHLNTFYYGRVSNSELPKLLNRNGIYFLPAKDTYKFGFRIGSEQFGFSLVEAMACGLAVISTDCGAIPEIITSNNIICKQGYTDDILVEMEKLLRDPSETYQIGQRNVEIVKEKYDINKQALKLTGSIKKIMIT